MKVKELIEYLKRYKDDEEIAVDIWTGYDVRDVLRDIPKFKDVKLSDEVCYEILAEFENWVPEKTRDQLKDTIEYYLEESPPDPIKELMDKAKDEAEG